MIVRLFNQPNDAYSIILVLMQPGEMMDYLREGQNRVVHIYRRSKIDLFFIVNLLKFVWCERPYAIHTHQEIELVYALLIKIFFPSIRLYHQIHLHNPVKNFWFWFERAVCRHFVYSVLAVSYTLKAYLLQNGFRNDLKVVYNILEQTNYMKDDERASFLQKIYYQSEDALIGMIGNFVKEKDQLTLAKAFKRLLDELGVKAKLVFIGRENTTAAECRDVFTRAEINRDVFFVGQIANASELISYFSVMVFSSKQETFGMAGLETLLYKVPLIASNIPVMQELSSNGKYFDLFAIGDYLSLAEKIKSVLESPPPNEQLEQSRNYVLRTFSASAVSKRLAQIYS